MRLALTQPMRTWHRPPKPRHGPSRKIDEHRRERASERDTSVARLLIHTRAAASSHICGGDAGVPRLQHTSVTCEAEQAVPLRTRNPSPPSWRRGRGASLYQCSAAGGTHPGRRSPAQCRTKPRCPSLLCRPRRVTSSGKVASHRRARGFGRAAARGGHCELTPPGARGRREMSTFGDTSSQVQWRGAALRVDTPNTHADGER